MLIDDRECLYRYEEIRYSLGLDQFDEPLPGYHLKLFLYKFPILKYTTKGVWIEHWNMKGKKFVLLSGKKRFAYPTKEEALESFKKRKERQIKILNGKLKCAKEALELANRNEKVVEDGIYNYGF